MDLKKEARKNETPVFDIFGFKRNAVGVNSSGQGSRKDLDLSTRSCKYKYIEENKDSKGKRRV